jgi:hypothetical protein
MGWVKWKDNRSAIRYIEETGSLANDLAGKDDKTTAKPTGIDSPN